MLPEKKISENIKCSMRKQTETNDPMYILKVTTIQRI